MALLLTAVAHATPYNAHSTCLQHHPGSEGIPCLCRLGKIAVTAACGLIAFGLSDLTYYTDPVNQPDSYLSSPLMPVLISVLVGYTISNLFLQVMTALGLRLLCV